MSALKLKSAAVSASFYGVKPFILRCTTTACSSASSLQFPSALSSVHTLSASPPNSWSFKTNPVFLIRDRRAYPTQKHRYFSDKKGFVKTGSFDALANSTSEKDSLIDDGEDRNEESEMKQNPRANNLFTLPTVLTIARVAAVPLFVSTFYVDSPWGAKATTSIFIAAAVTDWLDGYLARKLGLGSAFGAFLDPVADKLMVAATLVLLCTKPLNIPLLGEIPWLMTIPAIAIIGREITMSAVREWAASQDSKLLEAVAVNKLGKWKTATQMTALTILLATRDSSLGSPGLLVASGVVLLYISSGLAVWSLVVYMRNIWRVLLK